MNGPFYECGKIRELSEAKTKDGSLFYLNFWRKRQWDMNDLLAATLRNDGWLAYMVKAAV